MPNLSSLDPRAWTRRAQVHALVMSLVLIGAVCHNVALFHWYIEDAAIDFGFAGNIANGYGAVTQPGLERLEGYSNPTWLAVLVVFDFLGADLMVATHWIQLVICILTVPSVYFAGREVFGRKNDVALVPPAFLAANAQFAIWGQAGLENGLWNLLFVLGIWRMARELRDEEPGRRFPWSAGLWLLVALTRPEGILYAAVAGFVHLCWHVVERRTLVASLQWLGLFFVPWGVYQFVHYQYFAWPFPNTYYAKMTLKDGSSLDWNKRPWNWTRNFFLEMGQVFYLPVWLFSVLGRTGPRTLLVGASFALIGASLELSDNQRHLLLLVLSVLWFLFWLGLRATATDERSSRAILAMGTGMALALYAGSEAMRYYLEHVPNEVPVPELFKTAPPYLLIAVAAVLPLFSFGLERWALRVFCWWACWAAVFFAVYSEGDWMKGYRWFAMATVPASFLFGWGVDAFARQVDEMFSMPARERFQWGPLSATVVAICVLGQLPANVYQTWKVASSPDPAPRGIKPRIDYVRKVMEKINYREPVVSLDVDMGAHLLWTDWRMMDIAGLVDIPWAHHKFEKPFVREYLFQEMRPPYIHIHGGWATNVKINSHPEFRADYFEIPGFPAGDKSFHIGNYLRRDLVVKPGVRDEATGVSFERGVVVYPPVVPKAGGTGRKFELQVALRNPLVTENKKKTDDDFRLLLFAVRDGAVVKVWDVPPGFDWLWPHEWKAEEQFYGAMTLPVGTLEPGTYDLGYVVIWEDGTLLAPAESAPVPPGVVVGGRDGAPVRYARGEVVYPSAMTVVSNDERASLAREERLAAIASAEALDCEGAEAHWTGALQHRAGDREWRAEVLPNLERALSTCWATSSDGQERPEQLRRLMRARRWTFETEAYTSRATALASTLEAEGMAAHAAQDWESAYRLLSSAVELDGTRSFARRYAEEARAFRLGIDPASLEVSRAAEAAKRITTAKKQRKSTVIGKDHKFVRPNRPAVPKPIEEPATMEDAEPAVVEGGAG